MAALAFMDAPCSRMIVDAARSIAPERSVILQCPPALAGRLALYGASGVPGISLVVADEQ